MNLTTLRFAGAITFVSLLNVVGTSAAQQVLPDSLMACVSLSDNGKRLACLDREIARLAPTVEDVATAVAIEEQEAADEFGMNADLADRSSEKKAKEPKKEITGVVVLVGERSNGMFVVTLENGHIWIQKEVKSGFRVKEGDTVTIRRGMFGSFRMTGQGNRSFRVKRIN